MHHEPRPDRRSALAQQGPGRRSSTTSASAWATTRAASTASTPAAASPACRTRSSAASGMGRTAPDHWHAEEGRGRRRRAAGLEAARVAAAARASASCCSKKSGELGGQTLIAKLRPGRQDFDGATRWSSLQCRKLGVDIRLQLRATPDTILAESPDVVVIATGATARPPELDGMEEHRVVSAWDVLQGQAGEPGAGRAGDRRGVRPSRTDDRRVPARPRQGSGPDHQPGDDRQLPGGHDAAAAVATAVSRKACRSSTTWRPKRYGTAA